MANHKLTCLAVDDQGSSLSTLTGYIDLHPELTLLNSFTSSTAALDYLECLEHVDIIFLDMVMPEVNGLQLAQQLGRKFKKLVFTTVHKAHGHQAYNLEADAYLLKPYTFNKFCQIVKKMLANDQYANNRSAFANNSFYVKENNRLVKIYFDEIVAFESKLHFIFIHTIKATTKVYMTLSEVKHLLQLKENFVQVHRSFIVSETHIESISGNTIKLANDKLVHIGRNYREDLEMMINGKILHTRKTG